MELRIIDGPKIRAQREKLHLSLRQVAKRSRGEFTSSAVGSWEKGHYAPKSPKVFALCAALECDFEAISLEITSGK